MNDQIYKAQALEIAKMAKHINELEVENAKLREETEAAKHDLSLFSGELVASKLENIKLRELAGLLLYGMCHDAPPHEVLLWSQKVNRLIDELGIKEDE